LIPATRNRYFCEVNDVQLSAGFGTPFPDVLSVPGEGPEWRYTFVDGVDYAPPEGVLTCESDRSPTGPIPKGVTARMQICRGEVEQEGSVWAFRLRYTTLQSPDNAGVYGELVVASRRERGDG
jgi:hypothetical protein